jgi:hypothetical protein
VCVQYLYEVVRIFQVAPYSHFAGATTAQNWPFAPIVRVCCEGREIVRVSGSVGVAEIGVGACSALIRIGDGARSNIGEVEGTV